MLMRRVLFAVIGMMLSVSLFAEVYTVESVPSPKVAGQAYYVCNPDSVLADSVEASLNLLALYLDSLTEVEMAVVAIKAFDEYAYDAYGFALDLFNHWGIGGADKNTGLLVFLARDSRDIQIITGKGIEGIMTDAKCGEILDNNLYYLADNNFNMGMYYICSDICSYLMMDENRSELLLGWKPQSTEDEETKTVYFYIAFLILIALAFGAYKKLNGKPGQFKEELQEQAKGMQSTSGCLMFIFPIPLVFFYLYYRYARKHLKTIPLKCEKCGHDMNFVEDKDEAGELTKEQLVEEHIDSFQYIIWNCPDCGEKKVIQKRGKLYSKFEMCPECHARAVKLMDLKVTKPSTIGHRGEQINTLVCQCCGHKEERTIILPPKQTYSSSSSYSSGRSSSSSSYGGGWSSSSSSRSSSGSWGGGSSSGGGAGRKF